MAHNYRLRWKMPFKTFMGEILEVQIEQDGWTGSATEISDDGTGGMMFAAERPFETKGDTDTDIFKPIRTQSGYIRIVCKDDSWRDLMPNNNAQNRVKLIRKADNKILWLGFMRSEMYKHTLYEFADTYEFPVVCPLTILKQQYLDASNVSLDSFRSILASIFISFYPDIHFDFQWMFRNSEELNSKINRSLWVKANDEYVYDVTREAPVNQPSDTCYSILEQYCTAFGYVCQMDADTVTFSAIDEEGYRFADEVNSTYYADNQDLEEGRYTSELVRTPLVILDEEIIDDKTQEEIEPAYSKVRVLADIGDNQIGIEMPSHDDLLKMKYPNEIRESSYTEHTDEGDVTHYTVKRVYTPNVLEIPGERCYEHRYSFRDFILGFYIDDRENTN